MSATDAPGSSPTGKSQSPEDTDKKTPVDLKGSSSEEETSGTEELEKKDGAGEDADEEKEEAGDKKTEEDGFNPVVANAHTNGDWQAIWSPQHNMYYFYNTRTKETTWTNPLQPPGDAAGSSTEPKMSSTEAAAIAAGIDPSLAYLDPSLAAGPSNPAAYTYAAKFNARTGAFTAMDGRNPDHVSEYERMKRMNSFYFDQDSWERSVEERQEEETGTKRKKPSKKDLVRRFSSYFLVLGPDISP